MTLLPLAGIGLGCLGEASNDMVIRRRCVLGMGCVMAAFGFATEAWGLVFENSCLRRRRNGLQHEQIPGLAAGSDRCLAEAKIDRLSGVDGQQQIHRLCKRGCGFKHAKLSEAQDDRKGAN